VCASAPPLYIEGRTWRTHTHAAIKIQKKGAAIMADRDIEAVADRAAAPPPHEHAGAELVPYCDCCIEIQAKAEPRPERGREESDPA